MKTVAVIYGGQSTEHDVSVITALSSVIAPLKAQGKYQILPVYITKEGLWYADARLADISLYRSGKITALLQKLRPVRLALGGGLQCIQTNPLTRNQKRTPIDIVFPALHGTYGEDGSLMGMLRMAGVPFVGCDMDAAVIAMDKILAKQVVHASGLPVVPYVSFSRTRIMEKASEVIAEIEAAISYPVFVKPAHLGSSIGINRAANQAELQNALEVAAHYDARVLVEAEVPHLIEVTLPILGNHSLKPALLERPLLATGDSFFDFETKYMHGGKKGGKSTKHGAQGYSELPAKLDKALYEQAEALGLAAYEALGCQGTARIDMLIDSKQGTIYFNEANPLPGSLYAHNWRAAGMSSVTLVDTLIDLALERFEQQQLTATSFTTNYLQQF